MNKTFALCISFLVAGFFLSSCKKSLDALPMPTAIESKTFSDGEKIELIQVTKGEIKYESKPKNGIWVSFGSEPFSSGTYGHSVRGITSVSKQNEQKKLISLQFKSEIQDPLIVAFRWKDKDGNLLKPNLVNDGGVIMNVDLKTGSWGLPVCSSEIISGKSAQRDEMMPDILLQISDGKGGWISGNGPVCDPKDSHCSCVAFFPAWVRSEKEIHLRFIRCGKAPVEFSAQNPGLRQAAPFADAGKSLSKFVHPEFEVTLKKVKQHLHPDMFPELIPNIQFEQKVGDDWYWHWHQTAAGDEFGNEVHSHRFYYCLPEIGTQVRFSGVATPSNAHPYKLEECAVVGEGTIAADGSLMMKFLTVNDLHLNSGSCSVLPLAKKEQKGIVYVCSQKELKDLPGDPNISPTGFSFEFAGKCTTAEYNAQKSRFGEYSDWVVAVFKNGESQSIGVRDFGTSSFSDSQIKEYSVKERWVGRAKPGDTLKIALVRKKEPVMVSFIFDRAKIENGDAD